MQEPELYCKNCCNKINSINGYADFATIYTELKHMCLGDLGSKHLQTCLYFISCIYYVFILFILIGWHLFLHRAPSILETRVIYTQMFHYYYYYYYQCL